MKNKKIILSIVASIALIVLIIGATYAYFQAQTGEGAQTDIKINASTVDTLTFEAGSAISLSLDQDNFASGKGNKSGTTFAKAMLSANNKTNTATKYYYLYLNISKNTFTYTQNEDTPEILLTIKDDAGNEITKINDLTYKTITDGSGATIKGFDITTGIGLITLLNNKEITANPQKTDTWNVTVTFINYDSDQTKNAGKSFNAKLIAQQKEISYSVSDYCKNGDNLANCIISLGAPDIFGATKVYHHDENLVNGANDNSYRYAGGDKDMHPAYYSCKYNGNDVRNAEGKINTSLKGDCSSVSKVTVGEQEPIYQDKSINKIITGKEIVSWNSVNNKCLTSSGEEVTQSISGEVNETTCTGNAYLLEGKWTIGLTVEEVGAGEENLYSPASEGVKNFVCFGSTETSCPTDNLYRIIGVIDGKVKLIKYDYATSALLGTDGDYWESSTPDSTYYKGSLTSIDEYYWNYKNDTSINNGFGSNTWSTSLLNKINLNTNFINNIGSTWANKIATTTWKVGGTTYKNIVESVPTVAYQNEIVAPAENTTYDAKIGLMYATDYGFAASPSAWTTTLYEYGGTDANGTSIKTINWMYMGYSEWTISRWSNDFYKAFTVDYYGHMNDAYLFADLAVTNGVRPSFSLSSSITYVSGSGSMSDPILIN